MGNSAKRDARKAALLRKDAEALRLREQGLSYDDIAKKLGYANRAGAHVAVKRRLDQLKAECLEAAEDVRQLELSRLDRLHAGLAKRAERGDVRAVDRVLRIMERRSAYEGLDVPKRLNIELERNLLAFMQRVRSVVDADVYGRILSVAAGFSGEAAADGAPPGPGAGGGSDEGSSG